MEKFFLIPKGKRLLPDALQELLAWQEGKKKSVRNNIYIYPGLGFGSFQLTEHLLGTT